MKNGESVNMSVPKFSEFFEEFLRVIEDGELHSAKEVRDKIAVDMQLDDVELEEMLPSGRQKIFDNRVHWARTYLDKAGLIETPTRGKYRITNEGREVLNSGEKIDVKYLKRYPSFMEFHTVSNFKKVALDSSDDENSESPMEIMETAYAQVNNALAHQLMEEIIKISDSEFEKLVVKLLLKMGYGNGIEEAGRVTKRTNDGGIDGIIKEDQLGFSSIYIQAKQWNLDSTVGRPDIQKFVGALQGHQAQKGLFITTTTFSREAIHYADNLLGTKVVLINGEILTKLMIKYNVGVSIEHIYEIKRLDSDFFDEEL